MRALASDDPWFARQRSVLGVTLQEVDAHLGTLQITGPDGAEVWIDGALAAVLPAPAVAVVAKRLEVEVRAPGFQVDRREVDVPSRGNARVQVTLEREPSADVPAAPASPRLLAPLPERPSGAPARAEVWVAGGLAAFFSVAGVAFLSYAVDRAAHYNNDDECGDRPGSSRSERCAAYASQFRFAETAELTSFALAGAAAVTSAVLLSLHRRNDVRARVELSPAFAGTSVTTTF